MAGLFLPLLLFGILTDKQDDKYVTIKMMFTINMNINQNYKHMHSKLLILPVDGSIEPLHISRQKSTLIDSMSQNL